MLGLAFKAGTDDLRESPMVAVVETTDRKRNWFIHLRSRCHRRHRLIGSNRDYIERRFLTSGR